MLFRRKPTPAPLTAHASPPPMQSAATAVAAEPVTAPVTGPGVGPGVGPGASSTEDVVHPRDLLQGTGRWFKSWFGNLSLDKEVLIHQLIERPGAYVMWALKLGRFPKTAQDSLRDQNTVAGVLTWLALLNFVLTVVTIAAS